MDTLDILFGSAARVKIIKLFLFHTDSIFDKEEIMKRTKISSSSAIKELNILEKAGLIKRKSFFKEFKLKTKNKKKREKGYTLDLTFRYLLSLQSMMVGMVPMQNKELTERLSKGGTIKLIVISGIFIQDPDSRIDLLVAGDNLKPLKIKSIIGNIESEIGRSLNYVVFDTADLRYRMGICDRLVRDIFDYPHEVVVDRIGV